MGSFWEWILESSLLVMMILGIRRVFMGRIRYAGIYALWFVVLLRFMIPVNFISTPISIGNIISDKFPSWMQGQTEEEQDAMLSGQNSQRLRGMKSAQVKMESGAFYQNAEAGAARERLRDFLSRWSQINWKLILRNIWLVVSGIFFLWLILSNVCLIRRLKKDRRYYGKRGHVKIYVASGIHNPCLYGFFRPVIYLPQNLVGDGSRVKEQELEQIITHEYVHYCHGDHLWAMLRVLLVSVYWFDPFLWLAVSCSKKDAELFCDETVIHQLGEERRLEYGKMLVSLASDARWGDFRYPVMPMSRKGRELEKRIRAISNPGRYSKWVLIPLITAVIVAAGITCSTGIKPMAKETKMAGISAENTSDSQQFPDMSEGEKLQAEKEFVQDNTDNGNGDSDDSGLESLEQSLTEEDAVSFSSYNANTIERAFQAYIDTFTNAVNTGNTDQMDEVLAPDSKVYRQQCDLVKNYYKRRIHEEVKSCSISSVNTIASNQVTVNSREKIKVYYGDGTTKLVRQKYQYTCEYRDKGWIITKMDEIGQS